MKILVNLKLKNMLSSLFLFLVFSFIIFNFTSADVMDSLVGSDGKMSSANNSASIVGETLNTEKTLPDMISNVIKIMLGLFGTVALVFVIWGGVEWLLSKGDSGKIKIARDRMLAAAVGLAIIAAAYAITDFIIAQISFIAS